MRSLRLKCFVALLFVLPGLFRVHAEDNAAARPSATIHVDAVRGSDSADGTAEKPLATLAAAVARAEADGTAAEILLHGGVHRLERTLVLETKAPLVIRSADGEEAVVDGGKALTGWRRVAVNGHDAWQAEAPFPIQHLYYKGVMLKRAAFPKGDGLYRVRDQKATALFDRSDRFLADMESVAAVGDDWSGVDVFLLHRWISECMPVESCDAATGQIVSSRLSCLAIHARDTEYRLENVRAALQEEGEFYYDAREGTVTVILSDDLSAASAEQPVCPALGALLVVRDSSQVSLRNLVFRHAGAYYPACTAALDLRTEGLSVANHTLYGDPNDNASWLDRPGRKPLAAAAQAAANVPGCVIFDNCRQCEVTGCVFEASGWYGLELENGCSDIHIDRNEFRHLGAGAVRAGGPNGGTPSAACTSRLTITNNHIHDCGEIYMGAVGIFIAHAYGNLVEHNHIHDLPYTAISAGWVWGFGDSAARENRIGWNRIHDLGQDKMLSDMGGIYLLGIQPGTRIYNNFISNINRRYYGGWAIYLDEGSSHVVVEKNLAVDCASTLFHQHYGRENTVRWNVFAFGNDAVLQLSRGNEHMNLYPGENFSAALTCYQNVFVTDGKPFYASNQQKNLGRPTFIADGNVYFDIAAEAPAMRAFANALGEKAQCSREEWQQRGQDASAHFGDPGFADVRRRDFTLAADALLKRLNFPPLDLAHVGIQPE